MLKDELKQGLTQKSQMGIHLCKDFIPLRNDISLSRELLPPEYYFEFKVFLNCQNFDLNADRNVITNQDSDEISWIWNDFKLNVWPNIEAKTKPYKEMQLREESMIDAIRKTKEATDLKEGYPDVQNIIVSKQGANLNFIKQPEKEADVSHLLAMMVQSGYWERELTPISKFGRYIDASTDALVEDKNGKVLLVEIESKLANLFTHQHPMNSYDLVVVWTLGGLQNGDTRSAPWGLNGDFVNITLLETATKNWELKWGTHKKPVIVLEKIV